MHSMFLAEFFATLREEWVKFYEENFHLGGPAGRLERQLYILLGSGAIDQQTFFRLRQRLDRGHYIEGELKSLYRLALHRAGNSDFVIQTGGWDRLPKRLEMVYIHRARLIEAGVGLQAALLTMEHARQWNEQQAAELHGLAQSALPDEETARDYLEIRQKLIELNRQYDQRLSMMRHTVRRMREMETQLRLYESELLFLQAEEQAARAEFTSRKSLHS